MKNGGPVCLRNRELKLEWEKVEKEKKYPIKKI